VRVAFLGLISCASLLLVLAAPVTAGAQTPPPTPGPGSSPKPYDGPPPKPDEARGLASPATDPADIGLFVPRLVLFPGKLATQIVFFPLRHGMRFLQRHAVIERVASIFYNDDHTAAILPTFQFISAYGPTVGVSAFHTNMGGNGEKGEISAQAGGLVNQAYEASFSADRVSGSRMYVSSVARYDIRPRLLFQGIGDDGDVAQTGPLLDPRAAAVRTRFQQDRLLLAERAGYTIGKPGNLVKIGGAAIFNHRTFNSNPPSEIPSIESVYDTSKLVGFDRGTTTAELDATLVVDTRDSEGLTSSGVYVDAFLGGVPPVRQYHYVHYGLDAAGYIDLYKQNRVLVVRGEIEAVEGKYEDIPFSDLPRLGGPTRLRGYRLDRFRDKKSALATLEYQYPIHEMIGGAVFVDAGHVGSNYNELVDFKRWRVGVGGGIRVRSKDSMLFSFDLAYGDDGVLLFFTTTPLRAFANRERQL
jgi:hypothetical protein